jgi:hypothetical protein
MISIHPQANAPAIFVPIRPMLKQPKYHVLCEFLDLITSTRHTILLLQRS